MHDNTPSIDPMSWLLGIFGTLMTGWIGFTSKKVGDHSIEIAVLKEGQEHIQRSLDRLEDHFGTKPQE